MVAGKYKLVIQNCFKMGLPIEINVKLCLEILLESGILLMQKYLYNQVGQT